MSIMRTLLTCAALTSFAGLAQAQKPEIIQKPITFNEERKQLTLEYMSEHYGMEKDEPTIDPTMVVVHWTVVPTLEKTFSVFDPVRLPSYRKEIQSGGSVNVSSQFLIDRDGTIYQLMPENWMARHTIGLNYTAIGIENVADGKNLPMTEAQFDANLALIKYLAGKYPIEFVLGHSEYGVFKNTPYWKELDDNYFTHKTDPDVTFMERLRAALSDYELKKLPTTP